MLLDSALVIFLITFAGLDAFLLSRLQSLNCFLGNVTKKPHHFQAWKYLQGPYYPWVLQEGLGREC